MNKKTKTPTEPINNYKVERCDCSEDDNCGCPFYDTEDQKPNAKPSAKTSCPLQNKKNSK